jgi:hypothetical protein
MSHRFLIPVWVVSLGIILSTGISSADPITIMGPGGVEHTYVELNVSVLAFEAEPFGSGSFVALPLNPAPGVVVNILNLSSTSDFLAFASIPPGTYDKFRFIVDTSTVYLVESGTMIVSPVNIIDSSFLVEIVPPTTFVAGSPISLNWQSSFVSYDSTKNEFLLEQVFQVTPVTVRALGHQVTLPADFLGKTVTIEIIDLKGRIVQKAQLSATNDIKAYQAKLSRHGLYLIKYQAGNSMVVKKTFFFR